MADAQPIGPGTMLICVKWVDPFPDVEPSYRLTVNALYTCQEITSGVVGNCPWCNKPHEGIVLSQKHGVPTLKLMAAFHNWKYDQPLYCPTLFKPLNDGSTDLLTEEELNVHNSTIPIKQPVTA